MNRFFKSAFFPILIVVVLAYFAQQLISPGERRPDPSYSDFLVQVDRGQVREVTLNTKNNKIDVQPRRGTKYETAYPDNTEQALVNTLRLAVVTAGLLGAPAAVHRVTFRRGLKLETVVLGHRLFSAGLTLLALTLSGAVLLVLDVAVGRWFAIPVAAGTAVLLLALWFLLPLPLLRRGPVDPDEHHTVR